MGTCDKLGHDLSFQESKSYFGGGGGGCVYGASGCLMDNKLVYCLMMVMKSVSCIW